MSGPTRDDVVEVTPGLQDLAPGGHVELRARHRLGLRHQRFLRQRQALDTLGLERGQLFVRLLEPQVGGDTRRDLGRARPAW